MRKTEEEIIARGYAESLFGLSKVEGLVDQLEEEFFELKKVLAENFKLRDFLWDAKIPSENKKKLLDEILSEGASPLLRNQLTILIDQNRAHLTLKVAGDFLELVGKEKNRLLAEVITAVPLTDELAGKIEGKLSRLTGKNVSIKNTLDQAIVGGMVVKIDGKVLDLSIRKRLTDLKRGMEAT